MRGDNIAEYLMLISQLGFTMVWTILVSFAAGYWIDKRFTTSPLWTIVFLILGIAAGFWTVYKIIIKKIDAK
ncbi:MAG: AtpZ/AtpI family protein [Candidatus Omnitrophica bacterium]|nr:AtpZ/AtpI family protein [Candidatus Omnitrophota bacterium]